MLHAYLDKKEEREKRKGREKRRKRGPAAPVTSQACLRVGIKRWAALDKRRVTPESEGLAQSTGPAGQRPQDCATDLQAPGVQLRALPPTG